MYELHENSYWWWWWFFKRHAYIGGLLSLCAQFFGSDYHDNDKGEFLTVSMVNNWVVHTAVGLDDFCNGILWNLWRFFKESTEF